MSITKSQTQTLPEELLLKVLTEYLSLPNGLHSDRFHSIKVARVDKLLAVDPAISRLIPEAMYKHNRLIIKPSNYDGKYFRISYPTVRLSKYVRDLEFDFRMGDDQDWLQNGRQYSGPGGHQFQANWFRKLASGELGFGRLETLRLTFRGQGSLSEFYQNISGLVNALRANGPYRVRAKDLEVNVHRCRNGADCNEDCESTSAYSERMAACIKDLFQLHQDPLV